MKFIIILGFLVFAVAASRERFFCLPDVPLIENGCNTCTCDKSGDLSGPIVCGRFSCSNEDYDMLRNCKVGQTWTKLCNRCWCTPLMGTVCEDKKCLQQN